MSALGQKQIVEIGQLAFVALILTNNERPLRERQQARLWLTSRAQLRCEPFDYIEAQRWSLIALSSRRRSGDVV